MKSSKGGPFILLSKFRGLRDDDILQFYLKGDEDAKLELVYRYTVHSRKLAKTIYHDFSNASDIEFEDMVSIGLLSLMKVLNSYRDGNNLFSFWTTVATNDMHAYVKSNLYSKIYKITRILEDNGIMYPEYSELSDRNEERDTIHLNMLYEDIEKVLFDKKNNFKEEEAKLYLLVIKYGYSITELAGMYSVQYHTMYGKIARVRNRLNHILFKSNKN